MIGSELRTANKILVQAEVKLKPEFSHMVEENFHSSLMETDFEQAKVAADLINDWVEEQTRGTIKKLVNSKMLDRSTRMFLVNAIYFKAEWKHPFGEKRTEDGDFFTESGEKHRVQMMRHVKYPLLEICDFPKLKSRMLRLPYADSNVVMDILLPMSKEGLHFAEDNLGSVDLIRHFKEFAEKSRVQVVMPKFKLETNIAMKKNLEKLKMTDMFDPSTADFSKISSEQLWVADVVQKAFVEVTEQGTEAGAATAVMMT